MCVARDQVVDQECLRDAARTAGRAARGQTGESGGDARAAVIDVLARYGYEPEVGRRKEIAPANCPFHRLAEHERELVCGMNLDFVSGRLETLDPRGRLSARLDPAPGQCCVPIAAAARGS